MRRKFAVLVVISIILLSVDYFKFTKPLLNLTDPVIIFIKKSIFQETYKLRLLPVIILNYDNIVNDFEKIQKQNIENRDLKMQLEEEKSENASLRKQLGAPFKSNFILIPANVISVTRFMELNAGSVNGARSGQSVVDGKTLIGKIIQVSESRSQVQLITDREFVVSAITNRGSRGQVTGQMGEFLLFNEVLQKDPLFLEDILLTTGEGGFPKDLMVGQVERITTREAAVYKQAQIKPFINPQHLVKVFIVEER